jgi:hypothetical protein
VNKSPASRGEYEPVNGPVLALQMRRVRPLMVEYQLLDGGKRMSSSTLEV